MKWLDAVCERSVRSVARRSSRRGMLARLGRFAAGAALFPLLPYDRSARAQARAASAPHGVPASVNDPKHCDYWKHCAIDGWLCSCCGGSSSSCPPGSTPSPITWIGTCRNPNDGRDYMVSYNDCCGTTSCGHCLCSRNEGEKPLYKLSLDNDINWCMANPVSTYVCSVSYILGVAQK
ncbi:amine dehydrogenase [Burkholderia stabilis]|uniref:Aralkylamine dehydrogenase light chain,methylamine dehydrogenase (Amicyanin) light chain,Methylamine dehydrogenase, L chain n=2 Tax=Burkholderia stabilis TaxID=95485 RepID=A0AAJ5T8K1_9BURK|nr:methylamine dehydrogenase light chain [Burkholderia stabilis]AOR73400.1 amine dehydrogenase [Burkholderia stabilis]VBB16937.1 Aralkylamine dehydrogenase light chain precursor,methylamine dehydrogenase (amicyanin) light chain,Methylamine dehydrogenase, L chain [Burkholderia stabilis]HDR9495725.1 amine dehydrogenase [Burkholderia stabilis]HDR9526554.1 amine dehydrogenase [Burkholderia stabilis]HDR9542404.1 amine dehydrogenase [Burkholderia stabilis]